MPNFQRAYPWIGAVGIIAVLCASILWLSVPSFLLLAFPGHLAESFWYSLPDGTRTEPLYHVLVTIAHVVAALVPAALYIVLCRRVRRHPDRARRILPWSAGALMVLSASWYVAGWNFGMQYQGSFFVSLNLMVSGAFVVALAAVGVCWRSWRGPSLPVLFLWLEFAWVFACAFPWLGETF